MKKFAMTALCLVVASTASAKLGFQADVTAGMWLPSVGGDDNIVGFDVTDELKLGADTGLFLQARFQHPIPFIPNVALRQTNVQLSGNPDIADLAGFNFAGIKLPNDATKLDMAVDLSNTDFTLFWGVPLVPLADIHFGASVKLLRGGVELSGAGQSEDEQFMLPLPMFYLGAEVPLFFIPGIDAEVGSNAQFLPLGDSSVLDYQVFTRAYLPLPTNIIAKVGAEAGWRSFSIQLDGDSIDEDLHSQLGFSGAYIGLTGRF